MFSKISVGFTLQYFQMNQRNETHEENETVWCLSVNPINPQGFSECKKRRFAKIFLSYFWWRNISPKTKLSGIIYSLPNLCDLLSRDALFHLTKAQWPGLIKLQEGQKHTMKVVPINYVLYSQSHNSFAWGKVVLWCSCMVIFEAWQPLYAFIVWKSAMWALCFCAPQKKVSRTCLNDMTKWWQWTIP